MSIGHKSPTDLRGIFRSSEHIFDSTQTPVIKTKCFARYYEDLAVPKDKGYETASLELRNLHHTLMEDICDEEPKTHTQVITSEMIQNAVESLNTGKAEHGLKAEHFKNSPHSAYIFLEMCFKTGYWMIRLLLTYLKGTGYEYDGNVFVAGFYKYDGRKL